jgi:hypothetical protein
MNGFDYGRFSVILNILLLLFAFAFFFNKKVEQMGHNAEGWVWMQVVIGTCVTQICVGLLDLLLDWNAFFIGMLAYAVSGAPMIYGAVCRHLEAWGRARKAMNE